MRERARCTRRWVWLSVLAWLGLGACGGRALPTEEGSPAAEPGLEEPGPSGAGGRAPGRDPERREPWAGEPEPREPPSGEPDPLPPPAAELGCVVPERPVYFPPVQAELEASCTLAGCHRVDTPRQVIFYRGEPRLNYETLVGVMSPYLRCGDEALSSPILDKLQGLTHVGGYVPVPNLLRWLRSCALYDAASVPPAFCSAR